MEGFVNWKSDWLPLFAPLMLLFRSEWSKESITLGNGKTRTQSALGH